MSTAQTPTRQTRSSRYDGHGNVRCAACRQWRDPSEFGYPPSLKGRPTSYCRGCQREIDRTRWRGERRAKGNARRMVLQRQERRSHHRERRAFVQGAILTLRRRGITKTEISKLTDTSLTNLLKWERGSQTPTTAVVARFIAALRATAHLPLADEPVFRRRLPHPELDVLVERVRPTVRAHPVRSRWGARA